MNITNVPLKERGGLSRHFGNKNPLKKTSFDKAVVQNYH